MEENKGESPRSFATLSQEMVDEETGRSLNDSMSRELQTLLRALRNQSVARDGVVSGSLTLTLGIKVDRKGRVTLSPDIATKVPRPKPRDLDLWMTKGGNLSVEQPRQEKLPFGAAEGGANGAANTNTTNGSAAPGAAKEV